MPIHPLLLPARTRSPCQQGAADCIERFQGGDDCGVAAACVAIWSGDVRPEVESCARRMEDGSQMMARPKGRPVQNVNDYGVEDVRAASSLRTHPAWAESAVPAPAAEAER